MPGGEAVEILSYLLVSSMLIIQDLTGSFSETLSIFFIPY